jgi:putative membrane protein
MKRSLPVALALSLALVAPGFAAEKKSKKRTGPPSTLPPTSPMIVVPPAPDAAVKSSEPAKLISSEMSGKDLLFFTNAVDAGRLQAYLVGLLQARAESEKIKAVGAALAGTQEEENKQITKLAALKGWTVSTEATPAQKSAGAALEKLSGADFDKAVMDKVIAASQQSVSAYEAAVQSTDPDIKNFSQQMLPLAQEKLQLSERMTGAGKAAGQLFRTGAPPKAAPGATPSATKPAPAKSAPVATPSATPAAPVTSAPAATVTPASALPALPKPAVPSTPTPIPPPITK